MSTINVEEVKSNDNVSSYIAQYPVLGIARSDSGGPVHLNATRLLWEAFSHAAITAITAHSFIRTIIHQPLLIYKAE